MWFWKRLLGWKNPLLDPKLVRELATSRYIVNAENVLLPGPPGVGKTRLAVALGLEACAAGYRTPFASAASLVTTLTRPRARTVSGAFLGSLRS